MINLVVFFCLSIQGLYADGCTVGLNTGASVTGNVLGLEDGKLRLDGVAEGIGLQTIVGLKWMDRVLSGKKLDTVGLINGDHLVGNLLSLKGELVELAVQDGIKIQIGTKWISALGFGGEKLVGATKPKGKANIEDQVLLTNGDTLGCTVNGITSDSISIESQLGALDLPRGSIKCVSFAALREKASPGKGLQVEVHSISGDVVTGVLKGFRDGRFSIDTSYIGSYEIKCEHLLEIRIKNGAVVYLSDIDPSKVEEIPFFSVVQSYKRDQNVTGSPLSLRGRKYAKGLGVHSKTRITYKLASAFSSFQSVIGIDDKARGKGNVDFRIWNGDVRLFERKDVAGTSDLIPVSIDVSGVEELTLEVDFGRDFHIADYANWADARVIR